MSWKDDIENKILTVQTGDGQIYTPKWRMARRTMDFNTSSFDFINVDGSLVRRARTKGRHFNFEFFFDGENAITLANNFEISSRNTNTWTIQHPYYGRLVVQPVGGLYIDNSELNVSRIDISVQETLYQISAQNSTYAADEVALAALETTQVNADSFENMETDTVALTTQLEQLQAIYAKAIQTTNDLQQMKYFAQRAINQVAQAVVDNLAIISTIQDFLNFPSQANQLITSRYSMFNQSLNLLNYTLNAIAPTSRTLKQKQQYEIMSVGVLNAAILNAAIVDTFGYASATEVATMQTNLIANYNAFLQNVEDNTSARADQQNGYMPNFDVLNALDKQINILLSNIYLIANNVLNERTIILEEDSNAVNLTHRFYGLDSADNNLTQFISQNNLGINEILNIKKGRKITYYV